MNSANIHPVALAKTQESPLTFLSFHSTHLQGQNTPGPLSHLSSPHLLTLHLLQWPFIGHVTLSNQDKSHNIISPLRNLQWLPSALKIKPKDLVMQASLYMSRSLTSLWPCLLHHSPFHCVPATPASLLSVISMCQTHSHLKSLQWLLPGSRMLFLWNMAWLLLINFSFSSNSMNAGKPRLLS